MSESGGMRLVRRLAERTGTAAPARPVTSPPELGVRTIPGWWPRVLFAAVALTLILVGVPEGPWTGIAALLIAVAVWRPRWLTAWVLIGLLVLSSLTEPGTLTPRVLGLIAGAHALHLIGAWMLVVPPAARLQPRVLLASLRRFVLIQVPVQAAAVVLLLTRGAGVPVLAVASGAALLALVAVMLPALLRRVPR